MSFDALAGAAGDHCLSVLGAFHPDPRDNVPGECGTLVLLGPDEPRFWPVFAASPEALDGQPDAMDRWSTRVLTDWASALGATALFPFGGPPHRPFYSWALRSGRSHPSPVAFLVHDDAGLFVSFRGALALRERLDLPPPSPAPCLDCPALRHRLPRRRVDDRRLRRAGLQGISGKPQRPRLSHQRLRRSARLSSVTTVWPFACTIRLSYASFYRSLT